MSTNPGTLSLAGFKFQPLERATKNEYTQITAHNAARISRTNDVRSALHLSDSIPYLDFSGHCGTRDEAVHNAFLMLQLSAQYLKQTSKVIGRRTRKQQQKAKTLQGKLRKISSKLAEKDRHIRLLKTENEQLDEHLRAHQTLLRAMIPGFDEAELHGKSFTTPSNFEPLQTRTTNVAATTNRKSRPKVTNARPARPASSKFEQTKPKPKPERVPASTPTLQHDVSKPLTADSSNSRKKTQEPTAHLAPQESVAFPQHHDRGTRQVGLHRQHGNSEPDFAKVTALLDNESESEESNEPEAYTTKATSSPTVNFNIARETVIAPGVKLVNTTPAKEVTDHLRQQQDLARKKAKQRALERRNKDKPFNDKKNTLSSANAKTTNVPLLTGGKRPSPAATSTPAATTKTPSSKEKNVIKHQVQKTKTENPVATTPKAKSIGKPAFRLGTSVVIAAGSAVPVDQTGYIVKVNGDKTFNIKLDSGRETLYNVAESKMSLKIKRRQSFRNASPAKPPGTPPPKSTRKVTPKVNNPTSTEKQVEGVNKSRKVLDTPTPLKRGKPQTVATPKAEFVVGNKVLANFQQDGKFYPGTISAVDVQRKLASVNYDDGDFEEGIRFADMQLQDSIGPEQRKIFKVGQKVLCMNAPEEQELWQPNGTDHEVSFPPSTFTVFPVDIANLLRNITFCMLLCICFSISLPEFTKSTMTVHTTFVLMMG